MKELSYFEEQYNTAVSAKNQLLFKTVLCLFTALVFWTMTVLSLPRIAMAIVQLVFTVFVWGVCRSEMNDGLRSFLKLSPSTDSFSALALISVLAQSVRLLVSPTANDHCLACVLYLSIAVSLIMKLLFVQQITRNLDLIRDKKTYALQVADLSLSKKYIRQVCSANPVVDFPNVVRTSFDSDPTEKKSRKFIPIVALVSVAAAIGIGVIHQGLFWTAITALMIICASFTAEMAFVLPYIRMQTRLRKLGTILMGNYSVERLKEADTLLIKDTDLFPPERNEVLNLRIRNKRFTAEAIEYTASLLKISASPLEEAFRRAVPTLPNHIPEVLQWRIIKNYGIVATINIDNVLLGNRNLLLSHNVQPWSPEKEAMLTAAGVHLMYLVINSEIIATLIFRYVEDPELKKSAELLGGDFNILVETNDCNINESMIQRRYDLSRTKISVPDPDETEAVTEAREELSEDQKPPVMLSTQNALGILESIRQAKRLSKTVNLTILIQQISTVFGLILTAVALLLAPGAMNWLWLFAFNALWSLPVPFIVLFQSIK